MLRSDGASSRKYCLEALYIGCQIHALLSPKDAHSLIWNRFHKSKSSQGGNIPLDLMLEHYNNVMKNVIHLLGSNSTNTKAVDRFAKALTVNEQLLGGFDTSCNVRKRSGKHTQENAAKDLQKIVKELVKEEALTYKKGRKYKAYNGMNASLLDDFNWHSLYAWIEEHKRNISLNRSAR